MKYIFKELSEEEILGLTTEQLNTKIEEIIDIYKKLSKMSEFIIERKLSKIADDFNIIGIGIEPYYYGYISPIHTEFNVCCINNNNNNMKKIDLNKLTEIVNSEFKPLSFFVREQINFNIPDIPDIKFIYKNKINKNISTEKDLQGLKKQIQKLTPEQLQEKIEEIGKIAKKLNKILVSLVERKLIEITANYDIQTIEIEPYYLHTSNGFNHRINVKIDDMPYKLKNKMVPKSSEDAKDITYSDLEVKINVEFFPLKFFFHKEKISFNINELKIKHMYSKLERNLERNIFVKKPQEKSLCRKI